MGFLETKSKAAQYDAANAHNAKVAQEVMAMKANDLASENAYLKEGLAAMVAPRYNINPNGYTNVPGNEIPGYVMPSDGTAPDPRFAQPMLRDQLQGLAGQQGY